MHDELASVFCSGSIKYCSLQCIMITQQSEVLELKVYVFSLKNFYGMWGQRLSLKVCFSVCCYSWEDFAPLHNIILHAHYNYALKGKAYMSKTLHADASDVKSILIMKPGWTTIPRILHSLKSPSYRVHQGLYGFTFIPRVTPGIKILH